MNARRTYAPSGRANLPDLWPHAVMLLAVAGLLAVVSALLTGAGAYALGWWGLSVGGGMTGLARKLVRDSHCRNGPLAAAVLGAAGLVVFVGHYHADQCLRWGVGWHRLDRLPGFVTFRMETDRSWARDLRMPLAWPLEANPQVVPYRTPRVRPNLFWLALAGEFATVAVWPAAMAWAFARRPYSETLAAWYREESVVLTPDSAAELRLALTDGTLARWADLGVEKAHPKGGHVRLRVWLCPRPPDQPEVEPEVYLTLGKARPVLLTPEEVAALVEVFPALSDWATVPVELRLADLGQTPPPWNPALATFSRVPPPHAGRCKDVWVKWRGRLLAYGVLLAPLAALVGGATLGIPICRALDAVGVDATVFLVGYILAGLAVFVAYRVRYYNPNEDLTYRFLVAYYRGTMLAQAKCRDDALFDVGRPKVIYGEMIPRRVWGGIADHAVEAEGALLFIDTDSRRVFFEGDRYRWVIPFAAIRSYELEVALVEPEFHAVVLIFDTADGPKELPLVASAGLPGADRFERAAVLAYLLREAVSRNPAARGAAPASQER